MDPASNVNVRGKTAFSQGENVATLYVENENGRPVDGHRLTAIRQLARKIWNKFADVGQAPLTWGKANMNFTNEYRREICRQFPEFRLCENDWKAELLATENYSSWYSNRFGSKAKKDGYRAEKRKIRLPTHDEVDPAIKKQKVEPEFSEEKTIPSISSGNVIPEIGTSIVQPDVTSVDVINLDDLSDRAGDSEEVASSSGVVNSICLTEKSAGSVRPRSKPLNVRNSR
jgi:hypothetical protein